MTLSHKGMHEQNESSSSRQVFLQKGLCQDSDWLSKHAGAWDVGRWETVSSHWREFKFTTRHDWLIGAQDKAKVPGLSPRKPNFANETKQTATMTNISHSMSDSICSRHFTTCVIKQSSHCGSVCALGGDEGAGFILVK